MASRAILNYRLPSQIPPMLRLSPDDEEQLLAILRLQNDANQFCYPARNGLLDLWCKIRVQEECGRRMWRKSAVDNFGRTYVAIERELR